MCFLLKMVDIPASYVSLPEGTSCCMESLPPEVLFKLEVQQLEGNKCNLPFRRPSQEALMVFRSCIFVEPIGNI